jgi:hypothetical protein
VTDNGSVLCRARLIALSVSKVSASGAVMRVTDRGALRHIQRRKRPHSTIDESASIADVVLWDDPTFSINFRVVAFVKFATPII